MLLRYPVAKKSIRKHAIRSALREDLVCYTLGLEHVRQYRRLPHLPYLLPSKEEIRGSHLSQRKYHRYVNTCCTYSDPDMCVAMQHLHELDNRLTVARHACCLRMIQFTYSDNT